MHERWRFFGGACRAWETLTDFPLPLTSLRGKFSELSGTDILVWFPLIGALCGALLAGAGVLVTALTNRIAGAVAFALLALAFMLLKDSGRGILLLVSLLLNRRAYGEFGAAFSSASSDRAVLGTHSGSALAFILTAAEFLILLLMGLHGAGLFLAAILAGAFSVQGAAASCPDDSGAALITDPGHHGLRWMWWASAVVAVVCFLSFPLATAFGVGVVYAVAAVLSGFVRSVCPERSPDLVTLLGAVAEALLLLCGFFWALRF